MTRVGAVVGVILVGSGHIYGSVAALVVMGFLCWSAGLVVLFLVPNFGRKPLFATREEEYLDKQVESDLGIQENG